jgi:hypothetical protein
MVQSRVILIFVTGQPLLMSLTYTQDPLDYNGLPRFANHNPAFVCAVLAEGSDEHMHVRLPVDGQDQHSIH